MPVLLCDLGSVLFDCTLDRSIARWRETNGGHLGVGVVRELQDDAYRAFQAGRLGEAEYARHLRARLEWQGSDEELIEIWNEAVGPIDLDVLALLRELRNEGWYLVAAANTNPWHEGRWRSLYSEALPVFHAVATSTVVGVGVPDPRFFAAALRGVSATGPRLFVDGRPENVSAARRSGLDGHLFRDAAGLRTACRALLAAVH